MCNVIWYLIHKAKNIQVLFKIYVTYTELPKNVYSIFLYKMYNTLNGVKSVLGWKLLKVRSYPS